MHQDGAFVFANAAANRLCGTDDLVGHSPSDLARPEEAGENAGRRVAGGPVVAERRVLRRLDGLEVLVEVDARETTWRGEAAVAVELRDVTATAVEEAGAVAERERVSELLDAVGRLGVLVLTADGRVREASAGAAALYGRSPVGLRLDQLVGDPPTLEGDGVRHEGWHRRRGGSGRFWGSLDARATEHGWTAIVEDSTERARSERLLRGVLEHATAMIFVKDLDGRFLEFNPRCEEVTGVRRADVLGRDDTALGATPEEVAQWRANDRAAVEAGLPLRTLERYDGPSGPVVFDAMKFPVRDADGTTFAICGISIEVSERERLLVELERSNSDLGQFAYAASHDLVEPLRTVSGFADLLARRYGDALGEQGRQYVDLVVDGTKRMQALIDDLLEYSRVGRTGADERVELAMVFEDAVVALRERIEERGALVEVGALPAVRGSTSDLRRLAQHLLANALKFTAAGEAPRVGVSAADAGEGRWTVSVRDHGIGLDPARSDRVFGVFGRLNAREQYDGTGIGLAISRRVVERHGGEIWYEAPPDGEAGTVFCFTLPGA